jgi:hypothetical protein
MVPDKDTVGDTEKNGRMNHPGDSAMNQSYDYQVGGSLPPQSPTYSLPSVELDKLVGSNL